ncbi:hypothetical protein FKM82_009548 [Ascaphus truei]
MYILHCSNSVCLCALPSLQSSFLEAAVRKGDKKSCTLSGLNVQKQHIRERTLSDALTSTDISKEINFNYISKKTLTNVKTSKVNACVFHH